MYMYVHIHIYIYTCLYLCYKPENFGACGRQSWIVKSRTCTFSKVARQCLRVRVSTTHDTAQLLYLSVWQRTESACSSRVGGSPDLAWMRPYACASTFCSPLKKTAYRSQRLGSYILPSALPFPLRGATVDAHKRQPQR